MLHLVLGVSGSGKSSHLLQTIRTRALAGEKSVLIVPEQFTSSTEGGCISCWGTSCPAM